MLTTNLSENHLEQMTRGIKIIPRNLSFLITDMNKNLFNVNNKKEVKLNKIVKWIKSVLNLYDSNSFIDDSNKTKGEQNDVYDVYTKDNFKNVIFKKFKEKKEPFLSIDIIKIEDKYPKIINDLINI